MIKLNNEKEKNITLNCLKVSLDEEFFPDWEFHSLFGLSREDVIKIVSDWDKVDIKEENVQLAINNAFAHLLGYPHGKNIEDYLHITPKELKDIFDSIKN